MANTVQGESSSTSDASSSTPKWKYDVFLSFRGPDTRKKFTDHLYRALKTSGIRAFRDDEELERGDVISPQLTQAIKDSRCAVVVLSQNYADSRWCLNELHETLKSMKEMERRVFPIFYDVDPSDVRHQKKSFGEALAKHEKRFRENDDDGLNWFSALSKLGLCWGRCFGLSNTHPHMFEMQKWREALTEISDLAGWDTRDWHEANLIKNIVRTIWTYLCSALPSYDDNLVGIEQRMVNLMSHLEMWMDDVRFVGLWGMGGAGKTTLARLVYEQIRAEFEMCCFLENVRETLQTKGLFSLQEKLFSQLGIEVGIHDDHGRMMMIRKVLCNKKVLLVLDDLDDGSPLEKLAESPDWFGKGSRIIITTRDKHVLTSCDAKIYEMKAMEEDESLQLFSKKAFKKDHPEEDYLELSKSVVAYAGGLPLALTVLGSFLYRRSKDEWADTLDKLKQIPNKDILQILKISYDGLDEKEKTIFLDIACLFKGWRKDEVTLLLEGCYLNPKIGISVLIEKTLLVEMRDSWGCPILEMHDLLEDLGKDIICQESSNPGNRSRLWKFEDIKEVLENNKGSEAIEAIRMRDIFSNPGYRHKIEVHRKAFSKMNIRLLEMERASFQLILPRELELSSALKVVRWPNFPLETLPLPLNKLVHIEMRGSKIKQLWNGRQYMEKLKWIDLEFSKNLIETPDFSGVPNLEYLNLYCCKSLVMVHPSLGELKRLVVINLRECSNLEILPRKLETDSLQRLDLSHCGKVAELPEFGEDVNELSYLDVSYTAITTLPESLGSLTGLGHLDLGICKILELDNLKTLITRQISSSNVTSSLTELYLNECGLDDGSLLDNFGGLSSLIVLDLSGNFFVNLPSGCFSGLFRLLYLFLDACKSLKSLPWLPPRLIRLSASNCVSMEALSELELWNLVASRDHENRGRIEYANANDGSERHAGGRHAIKDPSPFMFKDVKSEFLPQRDFIAIVPAGCEIPSWCTCTEYCDHLEWQCGEECEIKVEIPQSFRASKWFGIVVCLRVSSRDGGGNIWWSSKGAEGDRYVVQEWTHLIPPRSSKSTHPLLCIIMVLELNEKTCWQHLTPHNNSLHVLLSASGFDIKGWGWRLISKEEMQECSLRPTPRQVMLSQRLLHQVADPSIITCYIR